MGHVKLIFESSHRLKKKIAFLQAFIGLLVSVIAIGAAITQGPKAFSILAALTALFMFLTATLAFKDS